MASLGLPVGFVQWTATNESRDFRKARWRSLPMEKVTSTRESAFTRMFEIPQPSTGFAATFIEARYKLGDLEYGITTPVVVSEAKK